MLSLPLLLARSLAFSQSGIILTGLVWNYNVIRTSKASVKYDDENSFRHVQVQQLLIHAVSFSFSHFLSLSLSPSRFFFERVKSIEVLIMRLDWGVRESAGFGNYVHADRTLILHTHSQRNWKTWMEDKKKSEQNLQKKKQQKKNSENKIKM